MKRSAQILVEVLIAGIFLTLLVPRIPSICWRFAGPDTAEYNRQLALNAQWIHIAELKAHLGELQNQSADEQRRRMRARSLEEHAYALELMSGFTTRQSNLWADCLIEAEGKKINQAQKDELIRLIYSSSYAQMSCRDLKLPPTLKAFSTVMVARH